MPNYRRHHRLPLVCTLLLAGASSLLLAGCAGNAMSGLAFWKADSGPQVRTRADQLKDLRELAKTLPASDTAKQEQVTLELSQTIRTENDTIVRAQILRTISVCSTVGAGRVLAAGLQDGDSNVRAAACEGIGRRGGPDAVPALAGVLRSDTDIDVRIAAARGLGDARGDAAVEALVAALEDPNPALQLRGVRSLEKITGRDFGDDVEAWRTFCQGGTPQLRSESVATRLRRLL
jgi:hypothetical protein